MSCRDVTLQDVAPLAFAIAARLALLVVAACIAGLMEMA